MRSITAALLLLLLSCTQYNRPTVQIRNGESGPLPRPLGGADCARTEGYDALIVGGGLAGLAAAKELVHLGRSVLILEASDRTGGRASVGRINAGGPEDPPVPIDYGGSWIHGVPANPLTHLVDALGFDRARSELDGPLYYGAWPADDETRERFGEAWAQYEEALSDAAERIVHERSVTEEACEAARAVADGQLASTELCTLIGKSIVSDVDVADLCEQAWAVEDGDVAADAFCEEVESRVRVTSDVAADYFPDEERFSRELPWVASAVGPLGTAAELADSSVVDADGFAAGEDDLVAQGFGTFVRRYGEGLPVCLNAGVTRIEYSEDGVTVAAASRRYRADTVVVTVPLGVLRADAIEFVPPLPDWKREAIDGLRMGHMQKVIIPFTHDIFRDDPSNAWVMYQEDLGPEDRELAARAGFSAEEQGKRVMGFVIKPFEAPVAVAFHGGHWARFFESQCAGFEGGSGPRSISGCDDLAIDAAVRALSQMYGTETVAATIRADEIHVTRWSLEPFTRGAYSVPLPGAWDQREALRRPLAAGGSEDGALRVFFAGEASSRAMYSGSFAGAFETGLQAARDVHAEILFSIDGNP